MCCTAMASYRAPKPNPFSASPASIFALKCLLTFDFGVSLNVQILQMDTVITDGYRSYRIATDITLAARTCRRSLRTAMSTGVWVLEVLPRQAERVQRGRFVHPTTPPPSLLKRPPHLQSEASFGRQRECWCGLRSLMLLLWPNPPLEPAS